MNKYILMIPIILATLHIVYLSYTRKPKNSKLDEIILILFYCYCILGIVLIFLQVFYKIKLDDLYLFLLEFLLIPCSSLTLFKLNVRADIPFKFK